MVVAVAMDEGRPSVPWFAINDFAKKLSHSFISPGGPVAVVGAAASKRQRVSDFQQQATEALAGLAAEVQQGLAEQAAATGTPLSLNSIHAADLSVSLSSGPTCTTPAAAAAAAATAAGAPVWLAPLLPNHHPTIPDAARNLESWREGAAAAAAGVAAVRSGRVQPPPTVTAAGTGVTDDMLQPGSDTIITVIISEAGSEQTKVVLQEIQVLGSNTLADLRDSITCPLDRLAKGLGISNPASYFFIDDTFYDDTRQASNTECSALLQQWTSAAGILKPRALVHACKEVDDYEQQWQHGVQQQQHGRQQQESVVMQQVLDQQQELQQQQQHNQQLQHSNLQPPPQQQQPDLQQHPQQHLNQHPHALQQQHPDLQPHHQQQQHLDLQLHHQQQHPDLQLHHQQQHPNLQLHPQQQQHPDLQPHPQQQQPPNLQPPPPQQQQHPDLPPHPQQHQQQHPDLQAHQQQQPNLQLHPQQQQQQQHQNLQPHQQQQIQQQQQQQQPDLQPQLQQQQHPDLPLQPHHHQQQQQDSATGASQTTMQHTRLRDLHLQVSNRPLCLYSHQGFCEHQMMIADVRLVHRDDPQAKTAYPRTVYQVPVGKRFKCNICKSRKGASTLLVNHPETPEHVSMLCNSCAGLFDTTAYPNSKRVDLE